LRQLLSALPFLAALAGAGFFTITTWLLSAARRSESIQTITHLRVKIIGAVFLLASFHPLMDLYLTHPFQLSYYNRLVGGIRGAYRRGLETTYFMEAITPAFLQTLNARLPKDAAVNASFARFMFEFYQKEGRLRRDLRFSGSGPFDFYIVLNRRSALSPQERELMGSAARPAESVRVAGVPLVALFDIRKSH
jgi:hypothetical protein